VVTLGPIHEIHGRSASASVLSDIVYLLALRGLSRVRSLWLRNFGIVSPGIFESDLAA